MKRWFGGEEGIMRNWLEAARPFSLTAALIPILVGSALALATGVPVSPINFVIVLVGGVLLQVGTNMTNDAYDYLNAVDSEETPRASRVVIEGRLTPRQVLTGAYAVFATTLVLGIWLATRTTPLILVPVLLGIIAGYGYTAPPLEYKYRRMGIPVVFVMMGPLMVWAAYLGVGGTGVWLPFWVALPVGLLVAAILHANDLRDIDDDRRAKIRTLTGAMGFSPARMLYVALMLAPYAIIATLVVMHAVGTWALLSLLTLPLAFQTVRSSSQSGRERLAVLDQHTAKVHLLFGLLLSLGLGVARF